MVSIDIERLMNRANEFGRRPQNEFDTETVLFLKNENVCVGDVIVYMYTIKPLVNPFFVNIYLVFISEYIRLSLQS